MGSTPHMMNYNYWDGLRNQLQPLVDKCNIYPEDEMHVPIPWQAYKNGNGLPAHPSQANTLHTKCLVAPAGTRWLRDPTLQGKFKLQPHPGGGSTGHSRGYLKVKKQRFDVHYQDKDMYLHHLLCYMYHGPSPHPTRVVGHMCGNKLCILPWHLAYISQSTNVLMGYRKKKRKWCD